ncbi:MAG TPA: polyprenyl synthetase family protein [Bacteroidetes bacterium]|nr:polyprenyl synthetase family protein [Bacteroidota bacterium]
MSENTFSTDNLLACLALPDEPATLYDPIRYTLAMGGKRVRPMLVNAACGLCGGNVSLSKYAAAGIEALHNFTLIHDDIMDNAQTRRGFQTVHEKWDVSTAILSGDSLFAFAFGTLSFYAHSPDFSKNQVACLYDEFLKATKIVCEGQARDIEFESSPDVTIEDYTFMVTQKTAALLQSAMKIGAIIADADDATIDMAGQIGLNAGIAFQIQDDLLDAVGNPDKFGKKSGGDIIEGKKTYLSILAKTFADDSQKEFLNLIPGSKAITDEQVQQVVEIYNNTGVIDLTKKEINRLYAKSMDQLSIFADSVYRDEIKSLLNQLTVREN